VQDAAHAQNQPQQPRGVPGCPIASIPQHAATPCEAPYAATVKLHIIITALDRSTYVHMRYLGMLGLTSADVFVYLR